MTDQKQDEVFNRLRQMIVDCEADPDGPLMLSASVALEHAGDLRSLLGDAAPGVALERSEDYWAQAWLLRQYRVTAEAAGFGSIAEMMDAGLEASKGESATADLEPLLDAARELLALVLLKYGNLDADVNQAVARAQSAISKAMEGSTQPADWMPRFRALLENPAARREMRRYFEIGPGGGGDTSGVVGVSRPIQELGAGFGPGGGGVAPGVVGVAAPARDMGAGFGPGGGRGTPA